MLLCPSSWGLTALETSAPDNSLAFWTSSAPQAVSTFQDILSRGEYISKNFYFCTTPKIGPAQESSYAW